LNEASSKVLTQLKTYNYYYENIPLSYISYLFLITYPATNVNCM